MPNSRHLIWLKEVSLCCRHYASDSFSHLLKYITWVPNSNWRWGVCPSYVECFLRIFYPGLIISAMSCMHRYLNASIIKIFDKKTIPSPLRPSAINSYGFFMDNFIELHPWQKWISHEQRLETTEMLVLLDTMFSRRYQIFTKCLVFYIPIFCKQVADM